MPRKIYVLILEPNYCVYVTISCTYGLVQKYRERCIPQGIARVLICHCVEDPIHIVGNFGVNPGEAFSTALLQSVADHAILDDAP